MAKDIDDNGFVTYYDVPISTEGVYDYAGFQIDPDGTQFGLTAKQMKQVFKVYRPCGEVTSQQFIDSLQEMPLTDDHTPLGDENGLLAAEKNTHGVLFNVRMNDTKTGLLGDIKVFSKSLKKKIARGKKEISLGYTCKYRREMGMFNGKPYDFVQEDLYGNHVALVEAARMGHSCRVSDSKLMAQDSLMEIPDMPDDKKPTADEILEQLKGCSDEELAKVKDFLGCGKKDEGEDKKPEDDKPAEDAKKEEGEKPEEKKDEADDKADKSEDKPAEEEAKDEKPEEPKKDEEKPADDCKTACDAAVKEALAQYQKAQKLAEDCKSVFGNIAMDGLYTEKDVAVKVCAMDSALKDIPAESAVSALRGYLAGRKGVATPRTVAGDAKVKTGKFDFATAFAARK